MEITTLQQRIEEKAKQKLLNDLLDAYNKEQSVQSLVNNIVLFSPQLRMNHYYGRSHSKDTIEVSGEFTQKIFDYLLPKYISDATEELLHKIDEIDFWVKNNPNNNFEDLP